MHKTLRLGLLTLAALALSSSFAFAQTPSTPPDAPPTQQHAKTVKSKKRTGKKGSRKKGARKKPSAQTQ
jgi:hypothetical protein